MNTSLFIVLLFALQCGYWLVGKISAKNVQRKEDYFLAGKNVKLFPLIMTFLATQVGGGIILGSADEAYRFGWPVLLYPLGSAIGLIFLGSGIGRRLAGFKVSTVAQIFEVTYGSSGLKKIASALSIVSLFMILVAQIIASAKFLTSLGFDNTPLFVLFWGIVILYTAQGGLKAVISTDIVQAAFFSAVFLICFGYVLSFEPTISFMKMPEMKHFADVSPKLCGWLLMPLLFMVIEQDMGQRCFAGASGKIVSLASFWAGVGTLIVCIIPVFLGVLANASDMQIPPESSVLMTMITKATNPWMSALVGCAILAAIISTATSLINAISSNLSSDFKKSSLEDSAKGAKVLTSIISIAAIFSAFFFDSVVGLLIQSYELSVSCLFIPLCIALFRKKGQFISAALSMACGAFGFILFKIYPLAIPSEIATLLLSLIGYSIGDLITMYRERMATHVNY